MEEGRAVALEPEGGPQRAAVGGGVPLNALGRSPAKAFRPAFRAVSLGCRWYSDSMKNVTLLFWWHPGPAW